jgi:hypothetical protein
MGTLAASNVSGLTIKEQRIVLTIALEIVCAYESQPELSFLEVQSIAMQSAHSHLSEARNN